MDLITVQVSVREPAGPVLRTFTRQFDADYTPGSAVSLENGLKLALSDGNVAAGDSFSFTARASMDTAGVLDALGLNTLFDGLGAGGIHVAERIVDQPENLAAALRKMPGDNHRLLDMAELRYAKVMDSNSATMHEHYRALLTGVATTLNAKQLERANQQQLISDLKDRRDALSGVSTDEEMVRLLQSQALYQAAVRFISATNQVLSDLASIV